MTSRECSRALKTTNFHSFKAKYKEMRGDARLLHNPIFLILSVYLNPKNYFALHWLCFCVLLSAHFVCIVVTLILSLRK